MVASCRDDCHDDISQIYVQYVHTHTDNKHTVTYFTLQNKKISLSCYVHPPWRMLSCLTSTSTAQDHSAADSSPSLTLASCLLAGRKKKTTYPSFLFFLSPHSKSHLLTAAGARESLSSRVSEHGCTSKFPAYFLLPASRWRCSAYKQLTASTILWSRDLGHYQIRAITCYNSSLPQQLPQAAQLNGAVGGCVCVSLLSSAGEDELCCVIATPEKCGTAINASRQ